MTENETAKAAPIPEKKPTEQDRFSSEVEAFVEYYWNQMAMAPPIERLYQQFPNTETAQLRKLLARALDRMERKGYNVPKSNWLSPEQLAVANCLLNLADKRSTKKKLDDFGVSAAVYANWRKDPTFINYIRERSETVLSDGIAEAHLALVDSAGSGDISAIKLLYEITGRHTPGSQQVQNIKAMLTAVIESVQKHVQDPTTLQAIAADIQFASGGIMTSSRELTS